MPQSDALILPTNLLILSSCSVQQIVQGLHNEIVATMHLRSDGA